ncbi:Alpha-ketoglutaric semialdehyde dehydrogenase 2 [Dyadobacter sp. CECT 9623]|uniref:Alpha-ketoglutaric semialdehyde dehydrogenase 2 n=1 Tax=Dyadobacter linearis TaxID=2823330 RepID=A0ABN7RFA1_9BACT|nr:aldehyde dehydrogenase (NADP(+)) [Dyadobacter sp. CECT 9623]CAG5070233.1 Alpha-ketoglutaric semialdehyde dehydrogenase 2 [Dyadobacter sp. CECT 9623]
MSIFQENLENTLQKTQEAFVEIQTYPIARRIQLMRTIADEIEALGPELIETARAESNLPEARLTGEKGRTIFQWRSYADAVEKGYSFDASIDTANPDRTPPKPDIRKTNVALGPVAVFGASNFPFAFSTAGGDTASAIAAGCPVVVKAHPGHPKTSQLMADAISRGVEKSGYPKGIFSHIFCETNEEAQALISHPVIKAVGFTGSNRGGLALVEIASKRPEPIPVFAEMGSINPVFLLPEKIETAAAALAKQYAGSLTLGVGQFCTNPGLVIGVESSALEEFENVLNEEIAKALPAPMLNAGIAKGYQTNREKVIGLSGVTVLSVATAEAAEGQGAATVATVSGVDFLINEDLQTEVFGPFALIVKCKSADEMFSVTEKLHGQLTATLLATAGDLGANAELVALIQNKCGRIIFNNFPTGVEVCKSMHHGGPVPSSSNAQYTSVGPDAIKRFTRPLSFQNWPDEFLPEELKNANPLGIWRTVDNEVVKGAIGF